ncbi:MAG: dTDP-4-dehydrorhamnose reductase [Clostridia bacterium]|nr:dTDP-4-dehydrorhamnose reductase [Clostridia bacterium]
MKVLVTGVKGQLGYDVVRELNERKIECVGADVEDFDITDRRQTFGFIENCMPDAIIHCAAYTAVDRAEDDEEKCRAVNADGTENIALCAKEIGAKMVYISTDYVFGDEGDNFLEVDFEKNPKNVYGKTKLLGEEAVIKNVEKSFIVRTSWVFGKNGGNFVRTMMRVGSQNEEVRVVADQIGSPTYTYDLSKLLCDMIMTEKYGVYHATNEGVCSWAEFCEEIFSFASIKSKVNHITTEQYPTKAKRPKNSRLSKSCLDRAGFKRLPPWQNALERYLKEIEE